MNSFQDLDKNRCMRTVTILLMLSVQKPIAQDPFLLTARLFVSKSTK